MVRVKSEEIDIEIYRRGQGLTQEQQRHFRVVTDSVWARNYMKKNKTNMKKLLSKIKKGVKHGKYTYMTWQEPVGRMDFEEPVRPKKSKKGKGKRKAKTIKEPKIEGKIIEPKKKKSISPANRQTVRKLRVSERKLKERAPSGREYSATELREGLGSKRARIWREKHGIAVNDYSK